MYVIATRFFLHKMLNLQIFLHYNLFLRHCNLFFGKYQNVLVSWKIWNITFHFPPGHRPSCSLNKPRACYTKATTSFYTPFKCEIQITAGVMTSSNGNFFHITDPLRGESAGHRWIPFIKASDAELWRFLWCATFCYCPSYTEICRILYH